MGISQYMTEKDTLTRRLRHPAKENAEEWICIWTVFSHTFERQWSGEGCGLYSEGRKTSDFYVAFGYSRGSSMCAFHCIFSANIATQKISIRFSRNVDTFAVYDFDASEFCFLLTRFYCRFRGKTAVKRRRGAAKYFILQHPLPYKLPLSP